MEILKEKQLVYVENSNDTIKLYSNDSNETDFSQNKPILFAREINNEQINLKVLFKNPKNNYCILAYRI